MAPYVTSRSAVTAKQRCPRLRYHQYESPNGTGTPGWERRKLALPLATGIYTHKGLEKVLTGTSPATAAREAALLYQQEVEGRGLQAESDDHLALIVDEQKAHVEALVLGWSRARLPRFLEQYEVVEAEQEDRVPLDEDVTLAVRADVIIRRRADGRMFVVNFKTVGQADERWLRQWEVDMQLMTELLAAERRHGQEFGGVIIEGLVKGPRVPVDQWLKEVRGDENREKVHHYADRSRLLYGYKCDADPPLVEAQYQWEGTTRKGWRKFATWQERFEGQGGLSSLEYWINWLPLEVIESQFVVVPPIMRDPERIASKVTQIIAIERSVRAGVLAVEQGVSLDATFPQHEHACTYPTKCPMYEMCWERGTAEDPLASGLYVPRVDHHALKENASG